MTEEIDADLLTIPLAKIERIAAVLNDVSFPLENSKRVEMAQTLISIIKELAEELQQ